MSGLGLAPIHLQTMVVRRLFSVLLPITRVSLKGLARNPVPAFAAMLAALPLAQAAVSVRLSPSTLSISVGSTQAFTVKVVGAFNSGVVWSVNGIPGGNSSVGTISAATQSTGVYTAPAS